MRSTDSEQFIGRWIVLFPLTFVVHFAEEWWGDFPASIARLSGLSIGFDTFIALNLVLVFAMTAVIGWTLRHPQRPVLVVALGAIVVVNGLVHSVAAMLSAGYAPGLITGLLLWLPLGVFTLARAKRLLPRGPLVAGITTGIAVHAVLALIMVGVGQRV